MTLLYTDLFPSSPVLQRLYFRTPGAFSVVAPGGTAFIKAATMGAGSWDAAKWGASGAYALSWVRAGKDDQFQIQVGDIYHAVGAGDALGNSFVKRLTDLSFVALAERGIGATSGGRTINCVGQVIKPGNMPSQAGTNGQGGAAPSDAGDVQPLGFGGAGGTLQLGAQPGAGGGRQIFIGGFTTSQGTTFDVPPGYGQVCVEFWSKNPFT